MDALDTGFDAGPLDIGPQDLGVDAGPICPTPPELSAIQTQIFGADGRPACNQAACHGSQDPKAGLDLTQPLQQLRAALLGPTVDTAAPEPSIVVPGDPDNSRLYVIVNEINPAGNGAGMPPGNRLEDCDVSTIRQWIADGAQAN